MNKKVIAVIVLSLAISSTPVFGVSHYMAQHDLRTTTLCSEKISDNSPRVKSKKFNLKEFIKIKHFNLKKAEIVKSPALQKPTKDVSLDLKKTIEKQLPIIEKTLVPTPTPEKELAPVQEKELAPRTIPVEEPTPTGSVLPFEKEVFNLVNIERSKNDLAALELDIAVTSVARNKSQDMMANNYFAHQSPTYGSAGEMLRRFGIEWSAWGENIAMGQKTPKEVMTAWMNSEGHRANILNPDFTKLGVGYVTNSSGKAYWTQMFIK